MKIHTTHKFIPEPCENLRREVRLIVEKRRLSEDRVARKRLRRPLRSGADPRSSQRSYLPSEKRRDPSSGLGQEHHTSEKPSGMASSDNAEVIVSV
ncbi:unnamed protein product [Trichogramma brassicae]|uniref:Uncharacterized protein n=1 Tax=Trichogramma brassicae TaxID=86971 RepID=A0A6H5I1V4_9HYME|nr:unnamed protein product [Trichogramma brassicae]